MKMTALSMADGCIARAAIAVSKPKHEVVVGNIGTVYNGARYMEAQKEYYQYIKESKTGRGRAGGETVTWMQDGDVFKEYIGDLDDDTEQNY